MAERKKVTYEGAFKELLSHRNRMYKMIQAEAVKMLNQGKQREEIRDKTAGMRRMYVMEFCGGLDKAIDVRANNLLREMMADVRLEDGSRAILNFPVAQIVELEDGSQVIEIDHEYHHVDEVRQSRPLIKQFFDDLSEKATSLIRNAPISEEAKAELLKEQKAKLDDERQRWMNAA